MVWLSSSAYFILFFSLLSFFFFNSSNAFLQPLLVCYTQTWILSFLSNTPLQHVFPIMVCHIFPLNHLFLWCICIHAHVPTSILNKLLGLRWMGMLQELTSYVIVCGNIIIVTLNTDFISGFSFTLTGSDLCFRRIFTMKLLRKA